MPEGIPPAIDPSDPRAFAIWALRYFLSISFISVFSPYHLGFHFVLFISVYDSPMPVKYAIRPFTALKQLFTDQASEDKYDKMLKLYGDKVIPEEAQKALENAIEMKTATSSTDGHESNKLFPGQTLRTLT